MDGARGQGIPRIESDAIAGVGGATSRLDQGISCVRGQINPKLKQKTEDFEKLHRDHKQLDAEHKKLIAESDRQ